MKNLSPLEQELLESLEKRFIQNNDRHPHIVWEDVYNKLKQQPAKIHTLLQMQQTGGEPDVVSLYDNEITFVDCSIETPKERRHVCYDPEALASRKQYKPANSAVNMAKEIGIELLNEEQYFQLQNFGNFDLKTSSWLATPPEIRAKGGALFGDYRFGRVFIYHNGAESYYGVRGFRGLLRL